MPQLFRSLHRLSSLLFAGAALASQAHAQTTTKIVVAGSPVVQHGALAERAAPGPADTLHLVFALPSSQGAGLDEYVRSQYDPSSPNYHRWLTPDEFGARFGSNDLDIAAVAGYARDQGFTVTRVWPNRLFVSVDARTADAERAFGVKLHGYARPPSETAAGLPPTFHAPDHDPSLPADVAAHVQAVFGLSTEGAARPALTRGADAALVPKSTPLAIPLSAPATPSDVASYYGFARLHRHGFSGENQSIAIFSPTHYGAGDFAAFESNYGLGLTVVSEVLVDGGATDSVGADEAALDLDITAGQAPRSHIFLYESPNDNNLDIWNKIASDNLPVVSVSYGYSEQSISARFAGSINTILQQMAAQGQSVFVASGDNGAFDGNALTPSVDFPASSPFVTAAGGTSIASDGSETGWSGSGGGLSTYFTRPSWQSGPGVLNTSSNGMRQTPDLSALADPSSPGYSIYFNGAFRIFAGTSASAPLLAATNVLINQGLGGRTGQLTPTLYQIGADAARSITAFNDITLGNNGFYSGAPNWDYVTGWGSPKADGLYSLLVPTALGPDPPVITLLAPNTVPAGSLGFTLTVTGSNFTASSIVDWNGAALATQFVSATILRATVPASLVSTVGTESVTVTDPDTATPAGPLTFTVTIAHAFAAGLQMISAPYDSTGASFSSLLGASVTTATWDTSIQLYAISPTAPSDTFHLGRAYWARLAAITNLVGAGTPAPASAPYSVAVAAGWNMIADPFNADAPLTSLQVASGGTTKSFAAAAAAGTVGGVLYRYDSGLRYYVAQSSGALAPYSGYWLHATHPCSLIFPAPTP